MAKKKSLKTAVGDHKHKSAQRKNIPIAKISGEGKIPTVGKVAYAYSPHLRPQLRFDTTNHADSLAGIVAKFDRNETLTKEEIDSLRVLAKNFEQPWLEWTEKKEQHDRGLFEIDPVALNIHERVSAKAIVRASERGEIQKSLFADPEQQYSELIQFYEHDIDWANRLILGDSLEVMSSLVQREDLGSSVKMIYLDPPYGINFKSNFMPEMGNREVKDNDKDLTRETEVVKAYRDTWHLGFHSYLTYLRDRLIVARDLLTDDGSIFVQIGDENLQWVRNVMDEVFGRQNYLVTIVLKKKSQSRINQSVNDFLLWYGKDSEKTFYRTLTTKQIPESDDSRFTKIELPSGERRKFEGALPAGARYINDDYPLVSQDESETRTVPIEIHGKTVRPGRNRHWSHDPIDGMRRLEHAGRLRPTENSARGIIYWDDDPRSPITNLWTEFHGERNLLYTVQTNRKIVERCILMTTNPGELVFDPTCGSGTTAYVAEEWGRRWITCDSSRVSVSIARQRIVTASFKRFAVKGESDSVEIANGTGVDPSADFEYETTSNITLGSIARNEHLDEIIDRYEGKLQSSIDHLNQQIGKVSDACRRNLLDKLATKLQTDGLRSLTENELLSWLLPGTSIDDLERAFKGRSRIKDKHLKQYADLVPANSRFEYWQIPYTADPDWPSELKQSLEDYREIWRSKRDEINKCIQANSNPKPVIDEPIVLPNIVRVSGPFTVEGVRPEELSLDEDGNVFDPTPNDWEQVDGVAVSNESAYLDRMTKLIASSGLDFQDNTHREFEKIEPITEAFGAIHAAGAWADTDASDLSIAIAFGPQHGPVTAEHVEDLIRSSRRYDELVIAAFGFTGPAQELIQEIEFDRQQVHMAHIRPDVSPGMDGLLKETSSSQIFTVFGQPEIAVERCGSKSQEFQVQLLGVDIYSPISGEIVSTGANKVKAWFLDTDYDGRCFCISQAFFPNQNAWRDIEKELRDSSAFLKAYNGTKSLEFKEGKHSRIAVKVIDPRGNEVMAIRSLKGIE
jgi:adenine-specific DNA-methyltransferase